MNRTHLLAAFTLSVASAASADLSWHSIDGGGGRSTGGSLELSGTIGQADAAIGAGGAVVLVGGFWGGASVGPTCVGDLDGSGVVGFGDLLAVLSSWGPCPPTCPEDLDGSSAVDFGDLLRILTAWGPCP